MNKEFYEGIVYRPPSEWNSLIIQSTIGCSHNQCSFCSMYKNKKFRIKSVEEVKSDIDIAKAICGDSRKIFLADGDALIRNTREQIEILSYIKKEMHMCERITCYASPKSILSKTEEELRAIKKAGIDMVYLGLESGSDKVLKDIKKGVTSEEIIKAAKKIKDVGIKLSVTAIIGIAGKENYEEHARETGKVLSLINPEYLGLLTLMLEDGTELMEKWKCGQFTLSSQIDLLKETKLILENIDSPGTVFRSNHASNYINLKGTLNKDKQEMIKVLDKALDGEINLKLEKFRGL